MAARKRSGRHRPELSVSSKQIVLDYVSQYRKEDVSFQQYIQKICVSFSLVGSLAKDATTEEKALRKKVNDYKRKLKNNEDFCKLELAIHDYKTIRRDTLILDEKVQQRLQEIRQAQSSAKEPTTPAKEPTTPAPTEDRDGDDLSQSASQCNLISDEFMEEGTVEDECGEGGKEGDVKEFTKNSFSKENVSNKNVSKKKRYT